MDFNEFKEQFTEDVKQGLADAGIEAKVSTNTVEKMNESYEAMTVTPEGSNVGVNVNMEKFFEAYEIAERVGFRDINVDLIAGLPGDRPSDKRKS